MAKWQTTNTSPLGASDISSYSTMSARPGFMGQKSYNTTDLILSDKKNSFHLGRKCKPVTEMLIVKRKGQSIHRWDRVKTLNHFKSVERNAGVEKTYRRASTFKKNVFGVALNQDILRFSDTFAYVRSNIETVMRECGNHRREHIDVVDETSMFKKWVPVSIDCGECYSVVTTVKGPGTVFGRHG